MGLDGNGLSVLSKNWEAIIGEPVIVLIRKDLEPEKKARLMETLGALGIRYFVVPRKDFLDQGKYG